MDSKQAIRTPRQQTKATEPRKDRAPIFGLRYLEEESAEIRDIVGCAMADSCTCDDLDAIRM